MSSSVLYAFTDVSALHDCTDNFYVPSAKGYEAAMQCQEENWKLRLQS